MGWGVISGSALGPQFEQQAWPAETEVWIDMAREITPTLTDKSVTNVQTAIDDFTLQTLLHICSSMARKSHKESSSHTYLAEPNETSHH